MTKMQILCVQVPQDQFGELTTEIVDGIKIAIGWEQLAVIRTPEFKYGGKQDHRYCMKQSEEMWGKVIRDIMVSQGDVSCDKSKGSN